MTKKKVDELFFLLFCEKNSDGTKHLRLRGRELFQRIGRRLDETDMPELTRFLKKYPAVTSIDLAYNDLGDESMRILAQELFDEENSLLSMDLLHCDLHPEGFKWLSSAKHLKLQRIRLLGNKVGANGAQFIGRLIENCPSLENLDIGETDQTVESIESILMVVEKSPLKSINIARIIPNSYYSKYDSSTLADDLGVLLKLNETLEVLRVAKCGFDGHDVELLLGGLRVHKKLTLLDLGSNRIGDHGTILLAQWLQTRPALTGLRIPCNEIRSAGGTALGLGLPFSRVRLLDLNNNKIDDQGMQDIFNSIKKPTQMRKLFIWGNKMGEVALMKLAHLVKSGTLCADSIDIKIYYVDGKPRAAYNPVQHFKHRFYSVPDYGVPPELKIIRRKVPHPNAQPRALVDFEFIDRYPPIDESLGVKFPRDPGEALAEKPAYFKNEEDEDA